MSQSSVQILHLNRLLDLAKRKIFFIQTEDDYSPIEEQKLKETINWLEKYIFDLGNQSESKAARINYE